MKHDYIPEGGEEFAELEPVILELGDLSGIRDGEWPAIHKFEDPRLLQALLDAGLNPEITDKKGNSLLYQCVVHPECINLLIAQGVDVDRRCVGDETALMRASYMGEEDCVTALLKAGANPTLEFSAFAKVMLSMNEEKTEIIETARKKWNRKKKTPKATAKKK